MNNISVAILYEQIKNKFNECVLQAQAESGLPAFLIISALKEIICKYEMDARSELVKDYQSLLSEMSQDKEEENAESLSNTN